MNCFQSLGLPDQPMPSPDEVKQAWRLAAAKHHPDRGGDAGDFDRLRRAYDEALAEAEAPKPCTECGGSGKLQNTKGWHGIKLCCPHCDGTGVRG